MLALSGGKDSISTAILDHFYNGHRIDEIIFCEVMYDLKRNLSAEPLMSDFVWKKAKPVLESWGYKVTILRSETHDYLTFFNTIVRNTRKYPENEGKRRGFPLNGACGIKRDCKEKPMYRYLDELARKHGKVVQYVGICVEEKSRLESLYKNKYKRSLLADFGYTQQDSRALAEKYDLLSPSYCLSKRGGCFFCPWARISEFAYIKECFPELWAEFVALEDETGLVSNRWNIFKKSLKELDSLI